MARFTLTIAATLATATVLAAAIFVFPGCADWRLPVFCAAAILLLLHAELVAARS